jgi:opacity protein-like surface antigen
LVVKIRLSLIAAAFGLGGLLSPVSAQDAPAWAGVYLGAHLDGLLGKFAVDTTFQRTLPAPGAIATFGSPEWLAGGFGGGVSIGVNAQRNQVVVGLESDFTLTSLGNQADNNISSAALNAADLGAIIAPVDGFDSVHGLDVNWISTIRGRLGFTGGRILVFGTGGLALAGVSSTTEYFALQGNDVVLVSANASGIRAGYTLGAGTEIAVTPNLSVEAEYLFADFGTFPGPAGSYLANGIAQSFTSDERLRIHSFRLGVNRAIGQ